MPRIYMDEHNQRHVSQRIVERIGDLNHQKRVVAVIQQLLTMQAPPAALGEYMWHINVGTIGRIVLRGHSVRTVLSMDENYPGSTEYKIAGKMLVMA